MAVGSICLHKLLWVKTLRDSWETPLKREGEKHIRSKINKTKVVFKSEKKLFFWFFLFLKLD